MVCRRLAFDGNILIHFLNKGQVLWVLRITLRLVFLVFFQTVTGFMAQVNAGILSTFRSNCEFLERMLTRNEAPISQKPSLQHDRLIPGSPSAIDTHCRDQYKLNKTYLPKHLWLWLSYSETTFSSDVISVWFYLGGVSLFRNILVKRFCS